MGRVDLQRGAQQRLGCSWAGPGAPQFGEPAEEPLVAGSAGHQHPGQGLAAPQLVDLAQEGVSDLGGNPDGVVAGGHEPGRGVGQDERAGPFRPGGGQVQRQGAGVDLCQEGRPLAADLVQDHGKFFGVGLPRGRGAGGSGSEAPLPHRSNGISRENDARVRRNRAIPGSAQMMSIWLKPPVVITRSGGPWPSTW
jgi:hypothetical protein